MPPLRLLSNMFVRYSPIENVIATAAADFLSSSSAKTGNVNEENVLIEAEQQHMMGQGIHDDVPMTTVGLLSILIYNNYTLELSESTKCFHIRISYNLMIHEIYKAE